MPAQGREEHGQGEGMGKRRDIQVDAPHFLTHSLIDGHW